MVEYHEAVITGATLYTVWSALGWLGSNSLFSFMGIVWFIIGCLFAVGWLLTLFAIFWCSWFVLMWTWSHVRNPSAPCDWTEWLTPEDSPAGKTFHAEWKGKKIPIEILYEAYMDKKINFKGDVHDTLKKHRFDFARMAFSKEHARYFFKDLIPQVLFHSKYQDCDQYVRPVYDRGNDFYNWFLGPTMIYTSGIFDTPETSLEDAQKNKLNMVCNKIQLKKGETMLDIGCGWGTLARHASKHFGAKVTGVTIAKEQIEWGNKKCKEEEVPEGTVDYLCIDYRDIPFKKYNKITCLEMSEHVGVIRYQAFMRQVYNMLEDDGIFYLQIAGLRRQWQFEDLCWGMFMGKYVFPAADASCPMNFAISELEAAGFEVRSSETIGIHYSLTIKAWYDNWVRNRTKVVAKYGEWWFRCWAIFLSWSSIIAAQGNSTCYMIVAHKNKDNYNRLRFVGEKLHCSA